MEENLNKSSVPVFGFPMCRCETQYCTH